MDISIDVSARSSRINKIAYLDSDNTLVIQFKTAENTAAFTGVPKKVFEDFLGAESPGRFYDDFVKGKYIVNNHEKTADDLVQQARNLLEQADEMSKQHSEKLGLKVGN